MLSINTKRKHAAISMPASDDEFSEFTDESGSAPEVLDVSDGDMSMLRFLRKNRNLWENLNAKRVKAEQDAADEVQRKKRVRLGFQLCHGNPAMENKLRQLTLAAEVKNKQQEMKKLVEKLNNQLEGNEELKAAIAELEELLKGKLVSASDILKLIKQANSKKKAAKQA